MHGFWDSMHVFLSMVLASTHALMHGIAKYWLASFHHFMNPMQDAVLLYICLHMVCFSINLVHGLTQHGTVWYLVRHFTILSMVFESNACSWPAWYWLGWGSQFDGPNIVVQFHACFFSARYEPFNQPRAWYSNSCILVVLLSILLASTWFAVLRIPEYDIWNPCMVFSSMVLAGMGFALRRGPCMVFEYKAWYYPACFFLANISSPFDDSIPTYCISQNDIC